jgi:hypothetical protein
MLHAVFILDARPRYRGQFTSARCELRSGEVVEVRRKRTPFYDLCRELDRLGYGERKIQIFTPTGTPSLRGKVSVLAGIDLREGKHGLVRRKYRSRSGVEGATQSDLGPEGTEPPPENEETRLDDSPGAKKAA